MTYVNNHKGSVQILFALVITSLLGATALVVDIGISMANRIDLSNSLDAAALAGGLELPAHPDRAQTVVRQYLEANGTDPDSVDITFTDNNQKMHLDGSRITYTLFARALGINTTTVGADASVAIGTAGSVYGGLRPLAVVNSPLTYGEQVILKEGAGDAVAGNYNAVSFGGNFGAAVFRNYLANGYSGRVAIGDIIDTEPGNMASSISTVQEVINLDASSDYTNFSPDSSRNWTIPVVEDWDVNGRDQVKVVGFAQFFIDSVAKKGGHAEVVGRFIQFTTNGEIDTTATNYGVYGIRLIR